MSKKYFTVLALICILSTIFAQSNSLLDGKITINPTFAGITTSLSKEQSERTFFEIINDSNEELKIIKINADEYLNIENAPSLVKPKTKITVFYTANLTKLGKGDFVKQIKLQTNFGELIPELQLSIDPEPLISATQTTKPTEKNNNITALGDGSSCSSTAFFNHGQYSYPGYLSGTNAAQYLEIELHGSSNVQFNLYHSSSVDFDFYVSGTCSSSTFSSTTCKATDTSSPSRVTCNLSGTGDYKIYIKVVSWTGSGSYTFETSNFTCNSGQCTSTHWEQCYQPNEKCCNRDNYDSDSSTAYGQYICQSNFNWKNCSPTTNDGVCTQPTLNLSPVENNYCTYSSSLWKFKDCGYSMYNGGDYCSNNDVYRDYVARGCSTSTQNCTAATENRLQQDCGNTSYGSWGSNYCKNGDSYHSRQVTAKGCSNNSCYSNTPTTEEQLVQSCNGAGCSNGSCNSCTNDCSSFGLKRCNGNSTETCGNYDADSCLEWGNLTSCGTGTCGSWSGNYCSGTSIKRDRTCNDKSCSNNACTSSNRTDTETIEDCANRNQTNPAWYYYCNGNQRKKYNERYEYGCSSASCIKTSTTKVNESIIETCQFGCNPAGSICNSGCSGYLYAIVEDKWDNKIANAEVIVNGTSQGKTDSTGKMKIPTLTESCGQTFTINAKSPNGKDCGTKTTIIDKQADNDYIYFECTDTLKTINLNISTIKDSFEQNELINFSISTKDSSNNNLNDASIGIDDSIKYYSTTTKTVNGMATYSTQGNIPAYYTFKFTAAKNGYQNITKDKGVWIVQSKNFDFDNDGLSDEDELIIGTDPRNSSDNMNSVMLNYQPTLGCFNPFSIIFSTELSESERNQLKQEIQSLSNSEVKALAIGQLSAQTLLPSTKTFSINNTQNVYLQDALKESDSIDTFMQGSNYVIITYDKEANATSFFIGIAHCAGMTIGLLYGAGQGVVDDFDFLKSILTGIYHYGTHITEILKVYDAVVSFLLSLPNLLGGLGEIFHDVSLSIFKTGATVPLAKQIFTANEDFKAYQIGFLSGYTVGYVAEQIVLLGKVADAFKAIKIGGQISDILSKALAKISQLFGGGTADAIKGLESAKFVLTQGTDLAQKGYGRIAKLLGDDALKIENFWKTIPKEEIAQFSERFEKTYNSIDTALQPTLEQVMKDEKLGQLTKAPNALENTAELIKKGATKTDIETITNAGTKLADVIDFVKNNKGINWLEKGNDAGGWLHIKRRHIDGIVKPGEPPATTFSQKFGVSDEATIQGWIKESINNFDPYLNNGNWVYEYTPAGYSNKMKTIVSQNGYIISAYPI